jgi:uncharacterized protein YcsI (UPF0317 family)
MHRPDNLLQKSAARKVSEDLKGTFIYEVTHPVHCALLSFLNAGVVGSHASEAELKEVLESWPDYAKARGIDIRGEARDFDKLWIDQDTIAAASGMGGNFEIALIVRS